MGLIFCQNTLGQKELEQKITFCEELEKIVGNIEGEMSRTKGFILLSLLRTLDYMKGNGLVVLQVRIDIKLMRIKHLI